MRLLMLLVMLLMALPALADYADQAGDRDGYRYSDNHAHGRYR